MTTANYRKIYEEHYGPIPTDSSNRTYDIHHIDGNRQNNDPSNLIALSVQAHYDIHYAQGDYGACLKIKRDMKLSKEEMLQHYKTLICKYDGENISLLDFVEFN
jgi:hypothetical protein